MFDVTESSGNSLLRMYNSAATQGIQLSATNANYTYFNGANVGIGTTAPTAVLDVAGAASVGGQLTFRSGSGTIQTTANQALTIGGNTTGNITLAPLNSTGFVSISTANQAKGLDMSSGGFIYFGNTNDGPPNASTMAGAKLVFYGGTNSQNSYAIGEESGAMWFNSLGDYKFYNAANNGGNPWAILKNATGYLGLNTTSPTATLDVAGAASIGGQLTFRSGTAQIQSTANQLLTLGGNTTGDIQFKPGNSSSSLYLSSTGNVGVHNTGPLGNLDIMGNSNPTLGGRTIIDDNGNFDPRIRFYRWNGSGANYYPFYIQLTGNVGGSPLLKFSTSQYSQAIGAETVSDIFSITGGLGSGIIGVNTDYPTATLDVVGSASVGGQLTFRSGTAQIQSTVNQGLTLGGNTTGNITLAPLNGAVGGNVVPSVNQQTDLGTSALQWRNIYAQNFIGGTTGIQGLWQRTLGSLAPTNITDDLLLGTTATSTAQFSVSNIAKNQALASLSGNLVVMPNNGWGGNVGIGVTSPSEKLQVNGNAIIGNTALGGTVSDSSPFTFSTAADAQNNTTSALYIAPTSTDAHRIFFGSSGTRRVYSVDFTNVVVGIDSIKTINGTTGLTFDLSRSSDAIYGVPAFGFTPSIDNARPVIFNNTRVTDSATSVGFVLKTTNTLSNAAAKFLALDNGTTNLMTVMANGNVGICISYPLFTNEQVHQTSINNINYDVL